MRQDRIIPVMRKELDEKNTITVYGNGERKSCFIRIDKLLESVDYFVQVKVDGVYNVGHENLSYIDLAENIVKKFGNKESTIVKKAHGNKKKFNLDISKLQKLIEL
jgi:nucleoside-diphosphate-sugar epimerase